MVGTNPYIVVALRRRSGRCTVCPCCLLPVPCAVCACVLLCSVCTLLRHQCVRACCCAVRACCCVCSARVLLCRSRVLLRLQCVLAAAWVRGCCCCVGRARSVRACVLLSRSTPGPFCRIRTFIPRGLETMVGLNPYHVVALRRRFGRPLRSPEARFIDFGRLYPGGGKQWSAPTPTMLWRCPVGPRSLRAVCSLSRVQSARACCCVVRACCCVSSAWEQLRWPFARACVRAASAVCGLSVRACVLLPRPPTARSAGFGRLYPGGGKQWSAATPTMLPGRSGRPPRSPTDGFIDFGRLYPGGGKQWSAPTPTLLWRCDVGTVGARSVRSVCAASSVRSLRVRARCCVACACCWVCCAWARAAPSALLCVLLLLESN